MKAYLSGLAFLCLAEAQYAPPRVLAQIENERLTESSGLAASRKHADVLWSHNDSGGGPWLHAFTRTGKALGRMRVRNAQSRDWEGLAIGPGPARDTRPHLYIGDIGDNGHRRRDIVIYRFPEPATIRDGGEVPGAQAFYFVYPDGPHNAECLMVHPGSGDLYIITKETGFQAPLIYKAPTPLQSGTRARLEQIGELRLPGVSALSLLAGRITGGDISPDGKRVIVCDYMQVWEARVPRGGKFDAVWKSDWVEVPMATRHQGEAVTYRSDGRGILATSEGSPFPLIEVLFTELPAGMK